MVWLFGVETNDDNDGSSDWRRCRRRSRQGAAGVGVNNADDAAADAAAADDDDDEEENDDDSDESMRYSKVAFTMQVLVLALPNDDRLGDKSRPDAINWYVCCRSPYCFGWYH